MHDALLKHVRCRNLTDVLWEESGLLIRPSEITGRPFSIFGAEISICHRHLLTVCTTCSHSCSESIIYPTSYLLLSDVTVLTGLDSSLSLSQEWQHNLCSPSFTKACKTPHQDVTESSKHKDYTHCQFHNVRWGAGIFRITILSIKN